MWCLRHAQSQNVVDGASGALPRAPLTDQGRAEAFAAAQALRDEQIACLYASTATRAQQTAQVLAGQLGIDVVSMPSLVEFGVGELEGSRDPETAALTARVLHAWVIRNDLTARVADGETGHQVLARVTAALAAITDAHPGGAVAVVGHVGSLTIAISALCGLGEQVWGAPLPHALPFLIERDERGWRCRTWPSAAPQRS
jgi:alpha-ribazole phosphatase/probable phosphoglycerate mutase